MYLGKTIVITGAGAGLGRGLALRLAKENASVWALDLNQEALDALALEGRKFGKKIEVRLCDVTNVETMTRIRDQIVTRGEPIAYWINNAGIAGLANFIEQPLEQFMRVIDVNLKAVALGTHLALEAMEHAGVGRIVNMASIAGRLPAPFMTAYSASKHGVVGFTRALQAELRIRNSPVSVLMVSPGFVDTSIIAKGEKLGFPSWLSFLLASPEAVVDAVIKALPTSAEEIYPTLNGRVMRSLYKVFPKSTIRSSKILLAKSWKDVVFNRYNM